MNGNTDCRGHRHSELRKISLSQLHLQVTEMTELILTAVRLGMRLIYQIWVV
jgi:hypothetical protein